jgi:hypothetical protein
VEAQPSNNSRKTYYAVIKSVIKATAPQTIIDIYDEKFRHYFGLIKAEAEKQKAMPKEDDDSLTMEEVIVARDQLIKDKDWQNALLLGCYTYLPPRRLDYNGMMVVHRKPGKKQTDFNYCVILKRKSYFIFNKFKTEKTHGQQIIQCPPELDRLIREWRAYNTTMWLFVKQDGDPMNDQRLSAHLIDLIERTTGKKAGASLLRHAFITDYLKGEKPLLEKKAIADMMAHSTHTQELYRRV